MASNVMVDDNRNQEDVMDVYNVTVSVHCFRLCMLTLTGQCALRCSNCQGYKAVDGHWQRYITQGSQGKTIILVDGHWQRYITQGSQGKTIILSTTIWTLTNLLLLSLYMGYIYLFIQMLGTYVIMCSTSPLICLSAPLLVIRDMFTNNTVWHVCYEMHKSRTRQHWIDEADSAEIIQDTLR
jgi:hypothetical protein